MIMGNNDCKIDLVSSLSVQSFDLKLILIGMDPNDYFEINLSQNFLADTLERLFEHLFPATCAAQGKIGRLLDAETNPDIPDIYRIFSQVIDEYTKGLCILFFFTEFGLPLELANLVSDALDTQSKKSYVAYDARGSEGPCDSLGKVYGHHDERGQVISDPYRMSVTVNIYQAYRPLEYAVSEGFWESRHAVLGWLRSLSLLYFMDKHQTKIEADQGMADDSVALTIFDLRQKGLISALPDSSTLVINDLGRNFIEQLIEETESYIDCYDHFRDVYYRSLGGEISPGSVQFESNRGVDLRVEIFLNNQLDPIRTVFLLLLYDGTLDQFTGDWQTVITNESIFEDLLRPVVDRNCVDEKTIHLLQKLGEDYLLSQRVQSGESKYQQEIIRLISE